MMINNVKYFEVWEKYRGKPSTFIADTNQGLCLIRWVADTVDDIKYIAFILKNNDYTRLKFSAIGLADYMEEALQPYVIQVIKGKIKSCEPISFEELKKEGYIPGFDIDYDSLVL